MELITSNLTISLVVGILAVITPFIVVFWSKIKAKISGWTGVDFDKTNIDEILEQAAIATYHEFVAEIKRDPNGTGKLSVEQVKKAMDMSIAKAKELSTGLVKDVGKDLLENKGKEFLQWGIEKALSRIKN